MVGESGTGLRWRQETGWNIALAYSGKHALMRQGSRFGVVQNAGAPAPRRAAVKKCKRVRQRGNDLVLERRHGAPRICDVQMTVLRRRRKNQAEFRCRRKKQEEQQKREREWSSPPSASFGECGSASNRMIARTGTQL